jgi:thiol-disulfide isomerase/thioredoxin
MPESPSPQHDPDPQAPGQTGRSARRGLPVGPLGLLLITAVALATAMGAASLVLRVVDDSGAVSVQEALDSTARAPLVLNTETRAEIGSPAPDVRLEYLDGGVEQLADVAGVGTPVVLNFWSSTCIPCLKEMPAFERVRARFEDQLTIVGIDVADTERAGREMVERTGVKYRNARDPRSQIFAVYGGLALPRTVLIAADGTVVETYSGELTEEQLTDLLVERGLVTR